MLGDLHPRGENTGEGSPPYPPQEPSRYRLGFFVGVDMVSVSVRI